MKIKGCIIITLIFGGFMVSAQNQVELLTFNGIQNVTLIDIDWSTASETNTDYFDIERGFDNINFSSIGTVTGAGTSVTQQDYNYSDNGPFVDTCYYYRLKVVYIDVSFEYVDTITVCYSSALPINENRKTNSLTLFPNPTTGKFSLQGVIGEIRLYDLFGRLVLSTNVPEIDMSGFTKGIYLVRTGKAVRKLVIH